MRASARRSRGGPRFDEEEPRCSRQDEAGQGGSRKGQGECSGVMSSPLLRTKKTRARPATSCDPEGLGRLNLVSLSDASSARAMKGRECGRSGLHQEEPRRGGAVVARALRGCTGPHGGRGGGEFTAGDRVYSGCFRLSVRWWRSGMGNEPQIHAGQWYRLAVYG